MHGLTACPSYFISFVQPISDPQTTIMPKPIELVPGHWVGDEHPVFFIAEIGQNHQGDVQICKKLIDVAKVSSTEFIKVI
jgi:hypothetical protein